MNNWTEQEIRGLFILITMIIVGFISAGGTWWNSENPFWGFLGGVVITWFVLNCILD